MKRGIVSRICRSVAMCVALAAASSVSLVYADGPRVTFELTDEPGSWFNNAAGPVAGFKSLAVATPGTEVRFTGKSNTVHTRTSLALDGAGTIPRVLNPPAASDLANLPSDLRKIAVPGPTPEALAEFVKDKQAAIALGKALFWDM